jgi:hypothetical protein
MALSIPVALFYSSLKDIDSREIKLRMLRILLWGFPLSSWLVIYFYPWLVLIKIQPYFVWALLVLIISIMVCLDFLGRKTLKQVD